MTPAHERAEQLFRESGGTLSAPEIVLRLRGEGYTNTNASTIRTWRRRYMWDAARELVSAVDNLEAIPASFIQASSSLLTLGVTCAEKLSAFVNSFAVKEVSQAEAVSRIMTEAVAAAAALDLGVIARYQASAARNGDTARVIDGVENKPKSDVDRIVSMFTNPKRGDHDPSKRR
ncbi:hypothetical protein [Methylocella sp.]|uniref:hypothetical protein n=1 Tax=Methylocella sp. TaxID=1978226 RepID=UPI003C193E00